MGGDHPQQCSLLAPNPRALLLTTVVSGGHPLALRIECSSGVPSRHTLIISLQAKPPAPLSGSGAHPHADPRPRPARPDPPPGGLSATAPAGQGARATGGAGPGRPPRGSCSFGRRERPGTPPHAGLPPSTGTETEPARPRAGEGPELSSPPCSLGTRPREQSPPGAAAQCHSGRVPGPGSGPRIPDPRRGSRARSPDPGPDLSRARPEHLPAPAAQSRAPARNKAGGGDAAPYLGERRVPRGDGRSKPGAEKRSSARAGRPPGSPPRPPQGPLEAARAIATAAPGRGSPGLSARPCGRQAGPPPRTPVRPRASPPAPAGPPNGGPTRRPLLRAFTRRRWGRRLES